MDKYQKEAKRISTELYNLSKQFELQGIKDYHNKARCEINKKYGKCWRSELDLKSIQEFPENHKGRFNNMSYY
jgi:hypothetical protein